MTPSRRQRLVDSVWPELEKLPGSVPGDRSLRKALVRPYSSTGTGMVRRTAADGSVADLTSGDDVLIERSFDVPIAEFLPSPTAAHPPVVAALAAELASYVDHERTVLSWIVKTYTQQLSATQAALPDGLVESIRRARGSLGMGPLDLLLTADRADDVESSEHGAAVVTALRGGSILRCTADADGILLARFPGPMLMGEVDPLRIDWDLGTADGNVQLVLWQRLRFFDAVP